MFKIVRLGFAIVKFYLVLFILLLSFACMGGGGVNNKGLDNKGLDNKGLYEGLIESGVDMEFFRKLDLRGVEITLPDYEEDVFVLYYRKGQYLKVIEEVLEVYGLSGEWDEDFRISFTRSYVAGMSFFRKGRYREAIGYFLMSVRYNSVIQDYIYYRLGVSYYRVKDFEGGRKYFSLLRRDYPFFRLLYKVIDLEGRHYLSRGNFSVILFEFLPLLERVGGISGLSGGLGGRLYFFLGRAYEGVGNYERSLFYYRSHLEVLSLLSHAGVVVKRLGSSIYKSRLEYLDYLYMGRYYFRVGDYRSLIFVLGKARVGLGVFSVGEKYMYISLLFLSYKRQGRYEKLSSLYEEGKLYFVSGSFFYKKLEYLYASSFMLRDSVESYKRLRVIVLDRSHPMSREASRDIMSLFEGRLSGGVDLSRDKLFVLGDLSSLLFRVLELGEYRFVERFFLSCLRDASNYGFILEVFSGIDYGVLVPYRRSLFYYWLGELCIRFGDRVRGVDFFKRSYLVHRRNYYSHISGFRLIGLLGEGNSFLEGMYEEERGGVRLFLSSSSFVERLSLVKGSYDFSVWGDIVFHRAFILLCVGELSEGYELFRGYLLGLEGRQSYYLVVAKLFEELGLKQYMINYMDFLLDYLNGSVNGGKLVPVLDRQVYPLYYRDIVFRESGRYGIDSYLVLGLIREESRFNSLAVSVSGAIGLMQLLPSTARWIARVGSGGNRFSGDIDLYEEGINVGLGVKYLNFLFARSPILRSVAGYNGGHNRVSRLYRKLGGADGGLMGDEHFIELLGIDETRNYVKRVMNSYYMYRLIYFSD